MLLSVYHSFCLVARPEGADVAPYAAEAARERPLDPTALRELAAALDASGAVRSAATARELAVELDAEAWDRRGPASASR